MSFFKKIICLVVLAVTVVAQISYAAAIPRPNFILILADDLGYGDIGPFGSKSNRTPNLDRMAREGMKLTSFYAAPVCTPSRAQILTGCYAKRVSLPNVIFPAAPVGLSAKEATIAELLKPSGYSTMVIGKWHVGDHPDFLPTRHGFDHYFGLPYSNDMGAKTADEMAGSKKIKKPGTPPLPLMRDDKVVEIVTSKGQEKITERYTDEAVKFIRKNQKTPFSSTCRMPQFTHRFIPATNSAVAPTVHLATGLRNWTGVSGVCLKR